MFATQGGRLECCLKCLRGCQTARARYMTVQLLCPVGAKRRVVARLS